MLIKQPKDMKISAPNGSLELKWNKNFGAATSQNMQKTQEFIDSECIRLMKPYMPFKNGFLEQSATLGTVIGSGEIHQNLPYAHYMYYGNVYGPNFPIVEENGNTSGMVVFGKYEGNGVIVGWCSPKGKKKHPTGRKLKYKTNGKHPQAGPFWFKRMVADKKDAILRGAAKISGGKAEE